MMADERTAALSLRWQRAALLGSLWAANEIILGSFLHNVQLPFAGTVLATMAAALLVTGARLWRDAGVIWRAGVVCSLMKSISPSAVIIGPMIGIMLEAFIIAAAAGAFRFTIAGCIIGGMIATVAPILQKIVAILLTYGMDAARMYSALFSVLAGMLGAADAEPGLLLVWFVAAQALPGAAAALAGILIARGVHEDIPRSIAWAEGPDATPDLLHSTTTRFSIGWLVAHALLMTAGLVGLPLLPPLATPMPAALYLSAVLLRYPALRPKFRRVRLWIELAAVAILAGILLGIVAPGDNGTWWTGLQSGIVMTARAIIVIGAFGAIGIELRNPVIMAWFLERGLGTLSAAMRVAFQALPSMLQGVAQERSALRHPLRAMRRMFGLIVFRLAELNPSPPGACVFMVSGPQGAGKTSSLARIAASLQKRGGIARGFLSHVVYERGERVGYDLGSLSSRAHVPLCRVQGLSGEHPGEQSGDLPGGLSGEHPGEQSGDLPGGHSGEHPGEPHGTPSGAPSIGRFTFRSETIAHGRAALAPAGGGERAVYFVDEVGPLEMQDGGWAPALPTLLRDPSAIVVLAVRPDLIVPVQEKFGFTAKKIWLVAGGTVDEHEIVDTLLLTSMAASHHP